MIKTLKAPVSSKLVMNTERSQNDGSSSKSKRTKTSDIGKSAKSKLRPNTTNIKISAVDQNINVIIKEKVKILDFKFLRDRKY